MRIPVPALFATVLLTGITGCVIQVGGDDNARPGSAVSSVFGGIDIDAERHVGDLSSVNGGIKLKDGVRAENLSVVNGGIELGRNVVVGEIDVVNGDIEAEVGLVVSGHVETVNGDIFFARDALVEKNISTVNGDIKLVSSTINGDISTVNGNITIKGSSVIRGDIIYEQRSDNNWGKNGRTPTLTLDENVEIGGNIILHRDIHLRLASPAQQAKVVKRYGTFSY